jgi:predicted RNA-binding protein Jag
MDDKKLNEALAFANYRLTLQVQRQNIEARVEAALLVSYNGAIFKATQTLINFVALRAIRSEKLLVEDNSNNVIAIDNVDQFLKTLLDAYDSAMQLKQDEQKRLKSARTTAKIVGL